MATRRRIAVLASGAGSNMGAIATACADGRISADLALVISNVGDAPVLNRARSYGLKSLLIPHRNYPSRDLFERAMLEQLREAAVDLVVLAGFMRILTPNFIRQYYGSLLNVHPSLLPKYPGLNTHQRALDAGDSKAGTTVHFVIPELDAGPIIAQAEVPIRASDDAASLQQRVQCEEHRIYPIAIQRCVEGSVVLRDELTD